MARFGGQGAIHLRAPAMAGRRLHDLALELAHHQANTGCRLVINDRLDIALSCGAWGLQLTSRSMSVADAAHIAPALALGASVHSVSDAALAGRTGAGWCVVRSAASEPGFDETAARTPLREMHAASALPIIAIGGIRPEHVATLRRAGAHGVAAIRGIWDAENAEQAAIDYLSAYEAHGGA